MTIPLFDGGRRDLIRSTASFSKCRKYRYVLERIWNDDRKPLLNFIMLNASTADEVANDPTVERCERRARMWHYGGLIVTNLFAWRSTDPRQLRDVADPVGPDNDEAIVESAHRAQLVVCAWGNHGRLLDRGEVVRKRINIFMPLHYLRLTKTGMPEHLLYLSYDLKPKVWTSTK